MKSEHNPELTYPRLHMNGSGKKDLLVPIIQTRGAISTALEEIVQCAPHMRDYYVYGNDGARIFEKARAEHYARINKLLEVNRELLMIGENVEGQGR